MKRFWTAFLALSVSLLSAAFAPLAADPISSISGTIQHFVLTSTPSGPGSVNATITLSGLQSGVPALTFNLGNIQLNSGPYVPTSSGVGYYGVNPWSAGPLNFTNSSAQTGSFDLFLTQAYTLAGPPQPGDPAVTKGELVLNGFVQLLSNNTGLDLSPFATGGLLSMTLFADPTSAPFASILAGGGTIEGTGIFTLTGNPISNVPEPTTLAVLGTGLAGMWLYRRWRS